MLSQLLALAKKINFYVNFFLLSPHNKMFDRFPRRHLRLSSTSWYNSLRNGRASVVRAKKLDKVHNLGSPRLPILESSGKHPRALAGTDRNANFLSMCLNNFIKIALPHFRRLENKNYC
jgi:hypothetical protein